jgi:hypothetical protein
MPHALSDSIAGRASPVPSALVCSWTTGGRDAAWAESPIEALAQLAERDCA